MLFRSNFDPSKKWPTLVSVYGGPASGSNVPTETFANPNPMTEYGFLVVNLSSRAAPVGVHVKPNGTTVVVKVESRDAADDGLVVEQYVTTFYRGVTGGEGAGEEAPDHKLTAAVKAGDPVATVEQMIDEGQTFRYADASGDRMPIHLDADRKSTRLNSSHMSESRMPSSA